MLQKLNERIQGVVAWVIIILVTLTFTLFGLDYYMQSRHSSAAKVKINGQEITKQSYDIHYRRSLQSQDAAKLNTITERRLKQEVLNQVIVNTLMVQAAHANGFLLNDAEANSAIAGIPQFQKNGHFSNVRYAEALRGALYTPESFQQEVKEGMLINQQRFALIGTEFSLPDELKQFVKLYMQKRDYSYLVIPASQFLQQVTVSDDEIAAYYNKHKKEYYSLEKVSLEYIRVSMDAIKKSINVSEEQLQQYYDENKHNYLTPAQWRVARISLNKDKNDSNNDDSKLIKEAQNLYDILKASPDKFNEKMKLVSSDKNSSNGVLPWITAGSSVYDKYFVDLTEVNQISKPIKSANGYDIFKLIEYKPANIKLFVEVKPMLKEQMIAEAAQNKYTEFLEKLADLSYQSPDSLEMASKLLNLEVEKSELFDKNGGTSEVTKNKQVIKAAFSQDVLNSGNNSDPVQLNNDSVIVLRIKDHILASANKLADIRPIIREKIIAKKAADAAKIFGEKLVSSNKVSVKDNIVNGKNTFKWQSIFKAGRDLDTVDSFINEIAFNISSVGMKKGITNLNGDFIIVYLQNIIDGDLESLDKEQISIITQQLESSYGLNDYNLYIDNLMSKAQIIKQ